MQIFLPYKSFDDSVKTLDKSRLGNQIWRECKTLIVGKWPNHPVSKMWIDYKPAIALYSLSGIRELLRRNDISQAKAMQLSMFYKRYLLHCPKPIPLPPFIGNQPFHESHRLNLLFKDPKHYSKFFTEPIPITKPIYIWPLP